MTLLAGEADAPVELRRERDEDVGGHVPVTVACEGCAVTAASSGLADGSLVRNAETPLRLTVRR